MHAHIFAHNFVKHLHTFVTLHTLVGMCTAHCAAECAPDCALLCAAECATGVITNANDQLATLLLAMTVINSSIQIRFGICNNNCWSVCSCISSHNLKTSPHFQSCTYFYNNCSYYNQSKECLYWKCAILMCACRVCMQSVQF